MSRCRDGPKLRDVDSQPGSKVGDVGTFSREGTKNSPGNCSGDPYTSSAKESFKSSFHALRIPNRTNGKASVQCSLAWHINAGFS
jgi:hypothetical protein